jgi:hypothetical protein
MKITPFVPIASLAILLGSLATEAAAQAPMAPDPVVTGGFLGQDYAGVEVGYVRHHDGPPRVLHRYGFLAARPMPNRENLDGFFNYNYTHGSHLGIDMNQHDFTTGLLAFRRNGPVAPFLQGGLGWAWSKTGSMQSNSFLYSIRGGVEFLLTPYASLTPTVTFREARRFDDQAWIFGVKAAFRMNRDWSASLGLQVDNADSHNVETAVGIQRRF